MKVKMVKAAVLRQMEGHYSLTIDLNIKWPNPSHILSRIGKPGHNVAVVNLPEEMVTAASTPQYDAVKKMGKAPALDLSKGESEVGAWDIYCANYPPITTSIGGKAWLAL